MRDRICIILLNANEKSATLDRLSSLTPKLFTPLVVDQGSTDGSIAAIRAAFPRVPIFENKKNLGTAGGNNVAIAWALKKPFKWIMLLGDETNELNFLETIKANPDTKISIEGASGFLIHRSVVETIGLFDPRLSCHWDKLDYCLRAQRKGFTINGELLEPIKENTYHWWRGRLLFLERNIPPFERKKRMKQAVYPEIWKIFRDYPFKSRKERAYLRASIFGVIHYYLGKFDHLE